MLETGEPIVNREEPYRRPDQTTGWFLTSKFPLRDSDGKIVGLVGVCRDVTGRREAQRKLEEERAFLETLIEGPTRGSS